MISTSILYLNKADQGIESESVAIRKQMYKFYNINASSVRAIMIADCPWLDDNFDPVAINESSSNKNVYSENSL